MTVSRDELDALFNSSDNEVEDERVKEYEERSNKSNQHLEELENNISSDNRPSFLEEVTSSEDDGDEEITLEDLMGSEDLNVDVSDEDELTLDDLSGDKGDIDDEVTLDDLSSSNDDDEEITLEDLMASDGDESVGDKSDKDEDFTENTEEVKDLEEDVSEGDEDTVFAKDISDVCNDKKYLKDPRYEEFYNQKLRAYNFLKENVPDIDYHKLRKEMEDFHISVRMDGVLSLDQFNEKIQQVQAVRNRLTKIKSLCIQSYVPRKRVIKLLEDCLMKESNERSSDKRAGEIQIHMSEMEYELALSESFLKDVEQIMENITTAHEALSRQITVIQERNREIQRGQEPYIDSSKDNYDSILLADENDNKNDTGEVGEMGYGDIRKKWKDLM